MLKSLEMERNYKEKLEKVTTFVFDVDGVFTDGKIILMPDGEQLRSVTTRDGYAVQFAVKAGFNIWVITGGRSEAVIKRFNGLGVDTVFINAKNKKEIVQSLMKERNVSSDQMLYMGDDLPDYEAMLLADTRTCPKDADHEILDICHYVSHIDGGEGCVRDVIEQTLRVQGKWFKATSIASI